MSEVGDTITSGADIDSPASPLGPGCPGAPVTFKEGNDSDTHFKVARGMGAKFCAGCSFHCPYQAVRALRQTSNLFYIPVLYLFINIYIFFSLLVVVFRLTGRFSTILALNTAIMQSFFSLP